MAPRKLAIAAESEEPEDRHDDECKAAQLEGCGKKSLVFDDTHVAGQSPQFRVR